jgi:putative SOS response-associated peptidase YedK
MFGIAMHYGSGKKQGELFAFAGLWDGWKDANGNWVKTCSILTTVPNAVTSPVHDRCPSSLIPTATIYGSIRDVSVASEMLKPYEARAMQCYPVSTRINHVGNDDPECSAPVELIEVQDRLFSL